MSVYAIASYIEAKMAKRVDANDDVVCVSLVKPKCDADVKKNKNWLYGRTITAHFLFVLKNKAGWIPSLDFIGLVQGPYK